MIESSQLAILVTWLSFVVLHPIITWVFSTRNTNWGRYWYVFITTLILTGIIAGFLITQPDKFSVVIGNLSSSN